MEQGPGHIRSPVPSGRPADTAAEQASATVLGLVDRLHGTQLGALRSSPPWASGPDPSTGPNPAPMVAETLAHQLVDARVGPDREQLIHPDGARSCNAERSFRITSTVMTFAALPSHRCGARVIVRRLVF